jgi:hypothetical protein
VQSLLKQLTLCLNSTARLLNAMRTYLTSLLAVLAAGSLSNKTGILPSSKAGGSREAGRSKS